MANEQCMPVVYASTIKVMMKLLKQNSDLVSGTICVSSVIENCSSNINQLIKNKPNEGSLYKLMNFQIRIITETQKLFSGEAFRGYQHVAEILVNLESLTNVNEELLKDSIESTLLSFLLKHVNCSSFINEFFQCHIHEGLEVPFIKLCSEVCEKIIENELLNNVVPPELCSNIIVQVITKISTIPIAVHQSSERYNFIMCFIVKILSSEDLSTDNFQFVERFLVEGMLNGNHWMGFICFQVFCLLIQNIQSLDIIVQHFKFFQHLLKILMGSSSNLSSASHLYISSLLKLIYHKYQVEMKEKVIESDIVHVILQIEDSSSHQRFNNAFKIFIKSPQESSYYQLVNYIKMMSILPDSSNVESRSNFIKLIQMIAEKNWNTYSALVIAIMDVIEREADAPKKIFLMMKLMTGLARNAHARFEIKLKLLDLLFSFAAIAKPNSNISNFLVQEINRLGNDPDDCEFILQQAVMRKIFQNLSDPSVIELVDSINFESEASMEIKEEDIIKSLSKNTLIKHKCQAITYTSNSETKPQVKNLETILKYSTWIQQQFLNDVERDLINQIQLNLCQIIKRNGLKRH